jgi:hypothetical protein
MVPHHTHPRHFQQQWQTPSSRSTFWKEGIFTNYVQACSNTSFFNRKAGRRLFSPFPLYAIDGCADNISFGSMGEGETPD